MSRKQELLSAIMVGFCCFCWTVSPSAQEPDNEGKPKPAARVLLPSISEPDSTDSLNQDTQHNWQPDTTPLTGLVGPTLGNPELRHSYWVPGVQYTATMQSGPVGGSNSGDWFAAHYLGGNLSLLKQGNRATLALNYSGGSVITGQTGQNNGWYQQLGAVQTFQFRRWQWQWSDQLAYLPQTQFGFAAGTGLAIPGIGGSLGPNVPEATTPTPSIFSATGPRYSNVAVVEGTFQLSARQSITAGGLDGILHFTQQGNVDSSNYVGNFGYNYALTKTDSIGLMYRFGAFHFQGNAQAYGESSVSLAYGRKITRRLALQAYGGPAIINYRVPIGGKSSEIAATAGANLIHALEQGSMTIEYYHGLSAGSGVLVGGQTDQVTFIGDRRITRLWNARASFGYASNRALGGSNGIASTSYDNYFAGGGLSRPMGRNLDFSISYTAYIQEANQQGCAGPNCNVNSTQHTVSVSVQWHPRPFVLE